MIINSKAQDSSSSINTHLYYQNRIDDRKSILVAQGYSFFITKDHIFVPRLLDPQKKIYQIQISDANMDIYEFKAAHFDSSKEE